MLGRKFLMPLQAILGVLPPTPPPPSIPYNTTGIIHSNNRLSQKSRRRRARWGGQ